MPIQAAANLYNREFPIRLANTMTDGLFYILCEDQGISTIPDIAHRHIAVRFRGDTPENIFGQRRQRFSRPVRWRSAPPLRSRSWPNFWPNAGGIGGARADERINLDIALAGRALAAKRSAQKS